MQAAGAAVLPAAAATAVAEGAAAEDAAVIERDRFGLGWRPEYAASLLARLDRVDVVEVLIEPSLRLDRRGRDALRTLARTIPLHLHGSLPRNGSIRDAFRRRRA